MADDGSFTVMGLNEKPFNPASQAAVDLLENIMPADKAQAVPRVLIWEIDGTTGKAIRPVSASDGRPKHPLSLNLVEPPKFGASVQRNSNGSDRFRERAPVSLERIVVKNKNPRGLISYNEIEITCTVHRPDVIYADVDQTDRDVWATLIIPGRVHALEYGWSASIGVKNGILNGLGFDDHDAKLKAADSDSGSVIEGRRQLRFSVVTYSFTILPDNQVRFMIKALEEGEWNLRQTFIVRPPEEQGAARAFGPVPAKKAPAQTQKEKAKTRIKVDIDPYADSRGELNKILDKFHNRIADDGTAKVDKKKGSKVIRFHDLLEIIFVPQIRKAFKEIKMEVAGIYVGRFNGRAGVPALKYGAGKDVGDQPISDFTIPLDEVQQIFATLTSAGERMTVHNFLLPFIRLFEQPHVWEREKTVRKASKLSEDDDSDPTEQTIPQVTIRTKFRRLDDGKIQASFFIFDVKREYVGFTKKDSEKLPPGSYTRAEIRKKVVDKGIPYISLVRANSFVQEVAFEVVQDELLKAIMMRRYLRDARNRKQIVSQTDVSSKEGTPPPDNRQIFSASIQGDITILGNFVFDVFMLVWIDFGIPQWDGPFNIIEREDTIEPSGFITRLKVQSAGTDPLGTQGRETAQPVA